LGDRRYTSIFFKLSSLRTGVEFEIFIFLAKKTCKWAGADLIAQGKIYTPEKE
jgi:hypothetical protein